MELGSSDQRQTAQGLNMATQEIGVETVQHTVRSTMAPNVGPPCSAAAGEDVPRRDTGFASFGGPSEVTLSTPRDFMSTATDQAQPVNGRDYDYFSLGESSRTPRNVTFRGVRQGRHKHREPAPDSSAESSGAEDLDETRRHIDGGSRGGAPRHTPPLTVGGLHGGASPRPTPPRGAPDEYSGASHTPPPSSVNWSSGRRRENTSGHRQGGGSAGGAIPHRSSSPLHASLPRRRESVSSRVLPTLKLAPYNGSTCLKTFLAKFENCSDYYAWDDRERLCHLRASLEGPAGQVLWDAGQQSSVEDVITLLKNRFGSLNEEERYRSELKARRRRRGESLQSVYQDIRRLMALAFPG